MGNHGSVGKCLWAVAAGAPETICDGELTASGGSRKPFSQGKKRVPWGATRHPGSPPAPGLPMRQSGSSEQNWASGVPNIPLGHNAHLGEMRGLNPILHKSLTVLNSESLRKSKS